MSMTKKNCAKTRMAFQVSKKIGYQFPDIPEGRLMFAILRQAIVDLCDRSACVRHAAWRHLSGFMRECEVCGIDQDWVREQIMKAGLCNFGDSK